MKKMAFAIGCLILFGGNCLAATDDFYTTEKVFIISMYHGADHIHNQKVDLLFPKANVDGTVFWGSLIIEVTGTYNYQNTTGKYTKEYGLGLNNNNAVYANNTQVTSNLGHVTTNVFLTPVKWNQNKQQYYITFVHRQPTSNGFVVKIKGFSKSRLSIQSIDKMTKSETYTSDPTVYPEDLWNVNDNALVVHRVTKNVGIGTTNIGNYKLNVAGKIRANEIIVNTQGADYVFMDNYKLKPLPEVEDFIERENHLPDIPSADEMHKNGIGVSEIQTLLLAKVEELTLYLIEIEKENEQLKERIEALEKR